VLAVQPLLATADRALVTSAVSARKASRIVARSSAPDGRLNARRLALYLMGVEKKLRFGLDALR